MLLVAFEDLDHTEAGRLAGCTPETFTVRVSRARKKLRIALAGALVPLLVLAAIALSPSKHDTLLQRAFGEDGSEILYWRIHTTEPGLAPLTYEVWMHISPSGAIDKVRRLRVDGPNTGDDQVFDGWVDELKSAIGGSVGAASRGGARSYGATRGNGQPASAGGYGGTIHESPGMQTGFNRAD